MYYFSIGLVVVSGVLYQLFQKKIAPGANPALSLILSYATAGILTLALFLVLPLRKPLGESLKDINAYSFLLALPIIGIELGYLLLYRAGGQVSTSGSMISAGITLVLLIMGILFFKEALTLKKALGLALSLGGVLILQSA